MASDISTLDEALAWAARTREFREAFVDRCACGELDLAAVRAALADEDVSSDLAPAERDRLDELRLLGVLEAIPQIGGKVASRRLMAAAGLPGDVQLGDVDDTAWSVLLSAARGGDGGTAARGGDGGTAARGGDGGAS